MTKKFLTILAVAGLLGLFATAAMAATGGEYVTVTVNQLDLLSVPGNVTLTLTTSTPGATAYDQGTKTDTDGLKYSHNYSSSKITASAVADLQNAGNDITLAVAIGDEDAKVVVAAGTPATGVTLWTGIDAGGYTKDLIWTADGTLAATKTGNYGWSVTFTSTVTQ